MKKFLVPGILTVLSFQLAALTVTHSQIRIDRLPPGASEQVFPEGWSEMDQFYPRYYKPGATVQIFLENNTDSPVENLKIRMNGKTMEELCTRPDFEGPVIWYRINPEKIMPGGRAMVYLRLRKIPDAPMNIFLENAATQTGITVSPDSVPPFRIGFAGFNATLDAVYVYAVKDSSAPAEIKSLYIDGVFVAPVRSANADLSTDAPAYFEVPLPRPLRYGQYIELKLEGDKSTSAVQVRALNNGFLRGIIGNNPEDAAKFFNLQYVLHNSNTFPEGFKSSEFIRWQPVSTEEQIKQTAIKVQPSAFIYGNMDEPDAHEPEGLPYMRRCGINIMKKVEPVMKMQRSLDPNHPTSLMIDRTYAPQNWFTYGEVPDLPFNDCYTPTQFMGNDPVIVAQTARFLINAFAPRPVNMMLWACTNTGHKIRRAPTPEENDMQVHFALGSGVKGLHYFLDWTSFPKQCEGGYYIGVSKIKPLWNQVGRNNAKIVRLQSFLYNSYPINISTSSTPQLWSSALMSGTDELLVFAVNRRLQVPGTDRVTFPFIHEATGNISVQLPPWFRFKRIVEVNWDKVVPLDLVPNDGKLVIPVRALKGGAVFLLSSDSAIADRLTIPDAQFAALLASEKTSPRIGVNLPSVDAPERVIHLSDSGRFELDFGNGGTLEKVSRLFINNGDAVFNPGNAMALWPFNVPEESRIELLLHFKATQPLKNLTIDFFGENAVGYHANMMLELIPASGPLTRDTTYKPEWFSGRNDKEKLSVRSKEQLTDFTVKLYLKTPNIVWFDDAAATARRLVLTWDK